ncbi:MAG: DNA polymerase IV [Acidimicrobiales bacterium]
MTTPEAGVGTSADSLDEALRILHVDMNAFYVEVERQQDPSLRGVPVIVGGTSDRGVVASASYEARAFGVCSAMPTMRARKLCPTAVVLSGSRGLYSEYSKRVHEVFASVTPIIEPIALDEAFLDIGGAKRLFGSAPAIADLIRREVLDHAGLECSVGVATKKLIAKLASEAAKPIADPRGVRPGIGVKVVSESEELEFLHAHPVRALWGVGPATLEKLRNFGISTVGDLSRVPIEGLVARLGRSHGTHLANLAQGIDDRPVQTGRQARSIGHEGTYDVDVTDRELLERELVRLADAVATRLRGSMVVARTVSVKVKFADFKLITRSVTLDAGVDTGPALYRLARGLLANVPVENGVRLLGLSTSGLGGDGPAQLTLDMTESPSSEASVLASEGEWRQVSSVMDEIRERFGSTAIGPVPAAIRRNPLPDTASDRWSS